jgi:hypothetical protein
MIEGGEVDLNSTFDICVCEWDGLMSFPGYSASVIPGVDNSVRLVKQN